MPIYVVALQDPIHWQQIKLVYYMSNSKARHLGQAQKALTKKLEVPLLNLFFDATYCAAHRTRPEDGQHYDADFNDYDLGWFYR